jgi:ribonuclease HIII
VQEMMEQDSALGKKTEDAKKRLERSGFSVIEVREINYGMQFRTTKDGWAGTVRIFENKKTGIKIDLSQIKGEKEDEVKNLLAGGASLPLNSRAIKKSHEAEYPYIGSDESGKGDYFGPLVAAAVLLDEQTEIELKKAGVRDSKDNTDQQNIRLAGIIRELCKGKYEIVEFEPAEYNFIYEEYKSRGKKLNSLLAAGHAKVINALLERHECGRAVIDQFANEKTIFGELGKEAKKMDIILTPKAESYTAVAAASILARSVFLNALEKLSEKYGIELLKGASDSVILRAKEFVKKHGRDKLKYVAKIHFKTTDSV